MRRFGIDTGVLEHRGQREEVVPVDEVSGAEEKGDNVAAACWWGSGGT